VALAREDVLDRDAERRSTVWRLGRARRRRGPAARAARQPAPGCTRAGSGSGPSNTTFAPDFASCDGPDHEDPIARLREALAALRTSRGDGVLSAARTVDPLLDLWGLATAVDRAAARPIERLLGTLVARSVTTAGDLAACVDQVEATLGRLSRR
jgi:hypothetical protein